MASKIPKGNIDGLEPEQWVDLYGDLMYRYTLSRISDEETAQDIVQEALMAAIQSFKRFKGQSSIKTWLVAILKRKIVDYYRRVETRQPPVEFDAMVDYLEQQFDHRGHWRVRPNDWVVNPGDIYEQKEFMDVLLHCLAEMPDRLAEIFMLREFEGLETQAICDQLNISESNSWVMLYRARMHLRSCMEENWLSHS
jgi:RNA polymerase sigma-70 factor (ECF subfamily)